MQLSLPLPRPDSASPISKKYGHRKTASQLSRQSDYNNLFISRTPSVKNDYYRPSSALSSAQSTQYPPPSVKDVQRINYINLSEAENDHLHIQRLQQVVSSPSLARKINKTQKQPANPPYSNIKGRRIASYDEFKKIGEFINVLKSGTSPMEIQVIRDLSQTRNSVKPTLAKIDIYSKDAKWLQSLDTTLLTKNLINTQLNLLKRSTHLRENTKRVQESLKTRPNMDGIAGHQEFFDINRKNLRFFRRGHGMTASSLYVKKQKEYVDSLQQKGDIFEMSPIDLASPIYNPREEQLFGIRGRHGTAKSWGVK